MPKNKDYGFGDPFEYARNASTGDGERFSMPDKAKDTTVQKPVTIERKSSISKSTTAVAPEAPKSTVDRAPKMETKSVTSAPAQKAAPKRNFDKAPPTPKPRPTQTASAPKEPRNATTIDAEYVKRRFSEPETPAKPKYQRSEFGRKLDDVTDTVMSWALPAMVGGAGLAARAAKTLDLTRKVKTAAKATTAAAKAKRTEPVVNAMGKTLKMDDKGWPKGTEKWSSGIAKAASKNKKK